MGDFAGLSTMARALPSTTRGNRLAVLLILFAIIVNGLALSGVCFALSEVKQRDIAQQEMQGMAQVQAIRQNIDNTISKIDIALKLISDSLESDVRNGAEKKETIVGVMDKIRYLITESEDVSVTDSDGSVVYHMGHDAPFYFNVRDREYFQDVMNGGKDTMYVSRPVRSRLSGHDILIFARAYRDRTGQFAGIIVIPVRLSYFSQQMSVFPLKGSEGLSLRGGDLSVIVRVPEGAAQTSGETDTPPGLKERIAANSTTGTVHDPTPSEGLDRVYAFARLSSSPIYVINSASEADYLEEWRHLSTIALGMVVLFLISTNFAAYMIFHYWRKERDKAAQLRESNDNLRDAITNLRELHESILAASEVGGLGTYALGLVDDRWVRSPEQEAIFGIDRDYPTTGEMWRSLIHDEDREKLLTYFNETVQTHLQPFDMEYRITRPSDGAIRWIHGVGKLELDAAGLPARLIGAVKDVTDQKESQERMAYLAFHDSLTGLPNRTLLVDRIHHALLQAKRHGEQLAVCYLDLDGFKPINDQWGHDFGDRILVEVAERLQGATRTGDTVARMGGDEFVVLLCRIGEEDELNGVSSRMLAAVARPYSHGGKSARLTLSMGMTVYPRDASEEPDALIRHADQALHEAKRKGKSCLCRFDPVNDLRQQEHQAHYTRLVEALERDEFCLYYQPKIDLSSGEVAGVEALIRWHHPDRGLLLPGSFLPGLENTDFTFPLGDWVLRQALHQIRHWQDGGLSLAVCINVFGHHLQQPDFIERLSLILQEFPDVSPSDLQMEILETTAMNDLDEVSRRLLDCQRLGISFSLDDFGTGYSSLNYFRRLPVKFLKIDRSFVQDIIDNVEDQALVESIVKMAHALNRQVVAEGVESVAHGVPLVRYGCDLAQGYGIARPMPAQAVVDWIPTWRMPDLWVAERPLVDAGDRYDRALR
jgi:diguanylate cyclase (GGDEF)-like protein/PAS domain S-box-containing protein